MALSINTNIASLRTQFALDNTNNKIQTAMQRLSTGLRINSAKDDAAGLSIATKMNSQIRGMTVAIRNANDGLSVSQTAESAIGTITESLQRARELAVQAKNTGASGSSDRTKLNDEFAQLTQEITRIINSTEYNGVKVLNGGLGSAKFQVGANATNDDTISLSISNLSTGSGISGLGSKSLTATAGLGSVINQIDTAINTVSTTRAKIGAFQNRIGAAISNLQAGIEAQTAAKGRIMDADFAAEMSKFTSDQILQQAGTAMLAQANQSQQVVLSLLR